MEWKSAVPKTPEAYTIAWMDEWSTANGNVHVSSEMKQKLSEFIDSLKQLQITCDKDAPDIYNDLDKMFLRTWGYQFGENQPWLL